MQFIDINEVENSDSIMQVEDLKNYIAIKELDLETWEDENPDDENIQSMKEEIEEMKELIDEFKENAVHSLIYIDYFEEYLKEELKDIYDIPDFLESYILWDSYAQNSQIDYVSTFINGEEYLSRAGY